MRIISFILTALLALQAEAAAQGSPTPPMMPGELSLKCPSYPNFSALEYAAAMRAAVIELRERDAARDAEGAAVVNGIIATIMKCRKKKTMEHDIMPEQRGCKSYEDAFSRLGESFGDLLESDIRVVPDLEAALEAAYARLDEHALACAKEMTDKCLDPRDTKAIDRTIKNINRMRWLTVEEQKGGKRTNYHLVANREGAGFSRRPLRFCSKTDYNCHVKGADAQADCRKRVLNIQSYIDGYLQTTSQ